MICPNDELTHLIAIAEDCAMRPERMGCHTLDNITLVLQRLQKAQSENRVLPDENDNRTWTEIKGDRIQARVVQLAGLIRELPLLT